MLKKKEKLLKRREYQTLSERGTLYRGDAVLIRYGVPESQMKVGITATKKYGIAVQRNRFKRRVKAAVRSIGNHPNLFFNVIADHHQKDIPFSRIVEDIKKFISHVSKNV